MMDNVSSADNLNFIMENDALGHTVMDQQQGHEGLMAVAGTVTLEEDFGKPTGPLHLLHVPIQRRFMSLKLSSQLFGVGSQLPLNQDWRNTLKQSRSLMCQIAICLGRIKDSQKPSFVLLGTGEVRKVQGKETGITQLRLSNGILVSYKTFGFGVCAPDGRGGVNKLTSWEMKFCQVKRLRTRL